MGVDDGRGRMMGDHVDVDRSRSADHRTRMDRSKSPVPEFNVRQGVEIVELQDKLEKTNNELRRAQAELRLNQSDYDRSHVELEQLHEKIEKSQAEIYRLRAKLESTQTENENYHDELEKLQSA